MALTVEAVATDPAVATYPVEASGGALRLRPLADADAPTLATFFMALSPLDRRRYSVGDDIDAQVAEHCAAVGRYDKVRLVLERDRLLVVGLFELSLDLTDDDIARFAGYGLELPAGTARFGLCLAASERGAGLASACMPHVCDLARRFGKTALMLWGGVRAENEPARRFYRRVGFTEVGGFTNSDGVDCRDGLLDLRPSAAPRPDAAAGRL